MGSGGSKMREFDEFARSINCVWQTVLKLQTKDPLRLVQEDWKDLKRVFLDLKAMASATSLVGNSKVMAHALPNLVAPVDREYTLNLLFGNKQIQNGKEREWKTLRTILEQFYYPISISVEFAAKAKGWMDKSTTFKWDTSPLKVVDNLIIGLQKRNPTGQSAPADLLP
jgi:hypothetical protein